MAYYDWGQKRVEQQRLSSRPDLTEEEVASARNDFAFQIFAKLIDRNEDKNVFFSPYSISSAMSMLLLGTGGDTEKELRRGLDYPNGEGIHEGNREIRESIGKKVQGLVLKTANRLYPDKSFNIKRNYVEDCEKFYGSELVEMDFRRNPDESRKAINEWVEEQTNKKIKDLMPAGSIDPSTVLVLVNAIYFKGKWAEEFKQSNTRELDFHVPGPGTKKVNMMQRKGKFNYGVSKKLAARVLEIPYKGGASSMLIVLPNENFGYKTVEKALTHQTLQEIETDREEVFLQLPKFKLEFGSGLIPIFEELGVREIFGPKADFSKISNSNDLFVSAIEHKAFVDVNEEGTEAAAATGIGMARMALPPPPVKFMCDHPFLFFIRHTESKMILFAGRYLGPE